MGIKIQGTDELIYKLKSLQEKAKDMSPAMKKIASAMKTKVRMNFKNQEDSEGNLWKKSKRAEKDNGITLSDTGRLKNSITSSYSGTYAVAGTNVRYARTMHFGAKKGSFGSHRVIQIVKPFSRTRLGKIEQVKTHIRIRNILSPWGDIPSRKFMGMSIQDKEKYMQIIKDELEKA